MWSTGVFLVTLVLAGCATAPPPAPAKSPSVTPIAEAGVGVTVWKFPVVGIGFWGFAPGVGQQVVIHQYTYQAMPPKTQYGIPAQPPGPPVPVVPPGEKKPEVEPQATTQPVPPALPQPVQIQTVYPPAPFDDPTLVIFHNISVRATLRLQVDDKTPFELPPGKATPNIHLDVGDHKVKVSGTVPTALGPREISERVVPLRIEPRDRSQIIFLQEF